LATSKYHRLEGKKFEWDLKRRGWLEALLQGSETLARSEQGGLLYYGDGIGGFTTVIKYPPDAMGNIQLMLANSGKPDASSRGDMMTQTLTAHFPMLFHKNPEKVMVLGLASGITAGDVLCYPVDKLDVVDINEQVVKASDFFGPWNNNVLTNPRTNLIIQDGRAHLNLTREKYDVIISEPSNPWMAGLAALFTLDFFELAGDRLNEGGIFVQFIHSYEMDWSTFALVGRTFARAFPNSLLILTEPSGAGSDFLMVGFKGEDGLTLENARKNFPFVQNSKNISLSDPRLLYRLIVSEDLEGLFGPGPVNTDSRPLLEFSAPKLIHQNDPAILLKILSKKRFRAETRDIIKWVMTDVDAQIGFATYALSLYSPFRNMVDLVNATVSQKDSFLGLLESYYTSNPLDLPLDTLLLNDLNLMQRCTVVQIKNLQDNIDLLPDKALSYTYLGRLYLSENMIDKAITSFKEAIRINPDHPEAHNDLGGTLFMQGKLDEAITRFAEVLKINPDYAEAHINLGNTLMKQDKLNRAINHFRDALQINPDYEKAYINLGLALTRQDKLEDAIKAYRKAIMLNPENADTYNELGVLMARQKKFDEAKIYLEKAIQSDPSMADPHVTLGKILIEQGEFDQAEMHFTKALDMRPELAGIFANILLGKGRPENAIKYLKRALQLEPDHIEVIDTLAWILATHEKMSVRDPDEAIRLAKYTCELSGFKKPNFLDTLAVAYAAAGRFSEAVYNAEKAMELARFSQQEQLGVEIKKHLDLFRSGLPFIENNS
ncbi:MAG: tetratricopeptide repeat protein, partial [Deltaproteobacteria bacterium]|nr:tetratricopeptide repeat protein [Deltaproteobacteria bacterium]MBW1915177.1 tetratricopeptide repeat protein [Deltaproteobacteria bacterium]